MCVANQTLKNEKCLVPCEGLYADIADDFLSQELAKSNERLQAVHTLVQQKFGGKM